MLPLLPLGDVAEPAPLGRTFDATGAGPPDHRAEVLIPDETRNGVPHESGNELRQVFARHFINKNQAIS